MVRAKGVRGRHADEIAIAHELDAGHRLRRRGLDGFERRVKSSGPQHPAMQHPGQAHVGRIFMFASDKVAAVHFGHGSARNLPVRCRRGGTLMGHGLDQLLTFGQFAKCDRLGAAGLGNFSIAQDQRRAIRLEMIRRQIQQRFTGGGADLVQSRRHLRRRLAAESAHVEGRQLRVRHDHFDGGHGGAQFFGNGLRERGADVLADFRFAGKDRHRAVLAHMQPGVDVAGNLSAAPAAPPGAP